jgi:hypothetical protein
MVFALAVKCRQVMALLPLTVFVVGNPTFIDFSDHYNTSWWVST